MVRKRKATIILLVFIVIIVAAIFIMKFLENTANNAYKDVKNSVLLDYEAYTSNLESLRVLYGVYDAKSYQKARTNADMSSDLFEKFYGSETYKGNIKQKPKVELEDVQYSISDTETMEYLVLLTVKTENKTETYNIIATYKGTTLIAFYNL